MDDLEYLSLSNLGLGAANEMFAEALEKVLENIHDINTDYKPARKITLEVSITPNEDRNKGKVQIKCIPKIAPQKSFETDIFMGFHQGAFVATELHKPEQMKLFGEEETKPITAIKGGKVD